MIPDTKKLYQEAMAAINKGLRHNNYLENIAESGFISWKSQD